MKTNTTFKRTTIERKPTDFGLSLEDTIRRAIATNQPIDGNAPKIYTESKDGVLPQYDVRTDKHDLALAAMDKYQASEHMKSFIGAQEYDENGFDGKIYKNEGGENAE